MSKFSIAPADDREITWGEYVARIWIEHEEFEIKDVEFHVWRYDEAEMDLTEVRQLERVFSHSLSFMNSAWCRPKVAIAWRRDVVRQPVVGHMVSSVGLLEFNLGSQKKTGIKTGRQ